MQDIYSIWFHDYDAKPSLLYRSAMRLRPEAWNFTPKMEEAKWWVLHDPSTEIEQKIMGLYQQQAIRPIIIILSEEKETEYHKSWAVLQTPLHYVTFFKWLDEVVLKIQNGSLKDEHSLYKIVESEENVFTDERWYRESFKLNSWPNVARFGYDAKVVELCALLLRNYHDLAFLKQKGFHEQLLYEFLSVTEAHDWLKYENNMPSVENDNASVEADIQINKEDEQKDEPVVNVEEDFTEAPEEAEKLSLFQTILKALKLK